MKLFNYLIFGNIANIIGELAYTLMGIWFLIMGQYAICIILIGVWIFATKLQNDFEKWVFNDDKKGGIDENIRKYL